MGTRLPAALAALFVLLIAAACGGSTPATAAPPTAAAASLAPTAAAPTGAAACTTDATGAEDVAIADFQFTPAELAISAGTAVTWTNNDSDPHTVTFSDGPDCGRMEQTDTVTVQFDTVGTFSYICTFHPDMEGTIIVE